MRVQFDILFLVGVIAILTYRPQKEACRDTNLKILYYMWRHSWVGTLVPHSIFEFNTGSDTLLFFD